MSGKHAKHASADDLRELDDICDRYEAALRNHQQPRLEDFLQSSRGDQFCESLFQELIELELIYRARAGENPVQDEYLERFPQYRSVILAVLDKQLLELVETQERRSTEVPPSAEEREDVAKQPSQTAPERLGRYRIEKSLGAGAFGVVYLAHDAELRRSVAIKVPHTQAFRDDESISKFIVEARTVAKLKHPGIVSVYDVGRGPDGRPYLVMEYIEGRPLDELIKTEGLTLRQTVQLTVEIADALSYAHRQGIVHRDLKPANVLVAEAGTAHITDFGLAVDEETQRSKAGEFAGTLAYMAPEQVRRETHRLDGRSDIWALGVMLYEMLLNKRPFGGDSISELSDEILHREPRPPRQMREDLPAALEQIFLKCCDKEITHRYTTASDLVADLRKVPEISRPPVTGATSQSTATAATGGVEQLFLAARKTTDSESAENAAAVTNTGRGRLATASILTLLIVALLVTLAIAPWRAGEEGALRGNIDVLVWNKEIPHRIGLRLHEAGVLPLRPNDQVRVAARLNKPAFVYIVWIDSRGVPLPIYPWTPGDWDSRPAHETTVDSVDLPTEFGAGWEVEGEPGMESLILLARNSPLPESVSLRALLEGAGAQHWQSNESLVEFEDGEMVTIDRDNTRGPKSFEVTDLNDPVMTLQRKIREKLAPHFTYTRTISFANGRRDAPGPL